jgi:glutathione synthase/RimK-type ligase-like ATP-grasp enzyme
LKETFTKKAVLFKSRERFTSFQKKLSEYNVDLTILDFDRNDWIEFDFSDIDFLIYYPSFEFSSNHPLALEKVYGNILFIHDAYPHLKIYPDPNIIRYYNDKYMQFLFLKTNSYPIPDTIPLFSEESADSADKELGYPMIIKNRFGAGGSSVFKISNKKELMRLYRLSRMDLFNAGALKHFYGMFSKRLFYWQIIKAKKAPYPFFSQPLIAQRYVNIDKDLKTVTGGYEVIEAHWRYQADSAMWKMNIDGGGTGIWEHVPEEALDLSVRLAKDLKASWLNIDMIMSGGRFLITEFSPVWHHYAYKEKPTFVYKDDYNIKTPLEVSLDLEKIITESLIRAVENEKVLNL